MMHLIVVQTIRGFRKLSQIVRFTLFGVIIGEKGVVWRIALHDWRAIWNLSLRIIIVIKITHVVIQLSVNLLRETWVLIIDGVGHIRCRYTGRIRQVFVRGGHAVQMLLGLFLDQIEAALVFHGEIRHVESYFEALIYHESHHIKVFTIIRLFFRALRSLHQDVFELRECFGRSFFVFF